MRLTRLILLSICAVLLFTVMPTISAQPPGDPDAAEPGEIITGIVSVEGSFVYVGPDFAYRLIGQLPLNASVTILGRRGDFRTRWNGDQWLQIQFGDRTAWVYARLIRTSIPFNSIPPTGRRLPRDRNGRVPEVFNLDENICDSWTGDFTLSGDFYAGDSQLTVTYPEMSGANVYSVITISPTGFRTAHDSETTTAIIELDRLPREPGTYTWRVAPYWTNSTSRFAWQQVCLLQTGGTFERPPIVDEDAMDMDEG